MSDLTIALLICAGLFLLLAFLHFLLGFPIGTSTGKDVSGGFDVDLDGWDDTCGGEDP